jgi:putative NADH-flavin reductase
MKFLVLGATGATGTLFVAQALAAGHDVTAYVRNPAKITTPHPHLTVVPGAADDTDKLASSLAGHDAIVSTLGRPPGKTDPTLMEDTTRALIRAADVSGVKRLLVMSAFGVGDSLPKGSLIGKIVYTRILGKVFADKARGETLLKASGLDWTIVYPVTLTNKPVSNDAIASPLADTPKLRGIPKVSRADVAAFLLQAAVNGSFMQQTVVLRSTN